MAFAASRAQERKPSRDRRLLGRFQAKQLEDCGHRFQPPCAHQSGPSSSATCFISSFSTISLSDASCAASNSRGFRQASGASGRSAPAQRQTQTGSVRLKENEMKDGMKKDEKKRWAYHHSRAPSARMPARASANPAGACGPARPSLRRPAARGPRTSGADRPAHARAPPASARHNIGFRDTLFCCCANDQRPDDDHVHKQTKA